MTPETAYHFVGATLRDGRPVPPDGEWLVYKGPCKMCESGLHVGPTPWDALQYAPGPVLCLVEVEDVVERHPDKWLCRRRRIVRRVDMTEALRAFARAEALRVIHLWDAPEIVRRYLETGDETIRSAAQTAAWAAAGAAAGAAARFAAQAAAQAAARSAAGDAAWFVARAAARSAAGAAARSVAGARFNALALALLDAQAAKETA